MFVDVAQKPFSCHILYYSILYLPIIFFTILNYSIDHFLSFFDKEPFYSEEQTKYMVSRSKDWCQWRDDELGYFAVLRKKKDGPTIHFSHSLA